MKPSSKINSTIIRTGRWVSAVAVAGALVVQTFAGSAADLLFSQNIDNQSTYGPSLVWSATGQNSELADDFNVVGNIDRVYASGFIWGPVDFRGAYLRFYEFGLDNRPGALQQEYFLAAGDPNLRFDTTYGALDATLATPFAATGRHFLSVQPVINYWYWWSADTGAPRGEAFFFRDLAAGETWHHGDNQPFSNPNADVSFFLYGSVTGPGTINGLSTNTLARSGYLEIFGANFGGSGTVLIDNLAAPVANWTSTRIVAYVPEAAQLATVAVQVVTPGGSSNVKPLTVTTRQSDGRVNWRFRMDGPYAEVRPAVSGDGTIYAIDVFNHLYALASDGALKWLVRGAGNKGVAVGGDGGVYVASEAAIKAFNPDGSERWTFAQEPRAFICLGVSVGPDGNIYSVGTQGMGVFSLTPAGTLRWTNAEPYSRLIVDYAEIVFGPNGNNQQLYFYANDHLRAVRLDGSSVFTIPGPMDYLRPGMQPAVAPDTSVHNALIAYSPTGDVLWSFPSPYPYNVLTEPDVGSNGRHYFVQNLIELFALDGNGSQRWHVTLTNNVAGPIVDPLNTQLVMGSSDTLDHAGFIVSTSAQDGHELWRVVLPLEDPTVFNSAIGIYGFNQYVDTRARFTRDGSTVYLVTATATGDNNTSKSFVYSLNSSVGTPPAGSTLLRSTSITLSAKLLKNGTVTVSGVVTVKDQNGATVPSATVAATWTLPSGVKQSQTANTSTSGAANFSVKAGRGTYTLTVNGITKTGCSFDSAHSVLSKSISAN